jgi:hypothetical protein
VRSPVGDTMTVGLRVPRGNSVVSTVGAGLGFVVGPPPTGSTVRKSDGKSEVKFDSDVDGDSDCDAD